MHVHKQQTLRITTTTTRVSCLQLMYVASDRACRAQGLLNFGVRFHAVVQTATVHTCMPVEKRLGGGSGGGVRLRVDGRGSYVL